MITCKECIYWQCPPRHKSFRNLAEFGFCNNGKFKKGYYLVSNIPNFVPKDGVLAENHEGWGILTGKDFGCSHGEDNPLFQ